MNQSKIKDLLVKGVEEIIVERDLLKKLKAGKKLRIKHGVDPTSSKLTLGHATVYHKLKEFQDAGHKIVFLIGDYTARFGDPTDKEKSRTLRDAKEVRVLAKNYLKQIGKIIDIKKTEVRYNSEWYDKMKAEDLLKLMSRFTIARLLERDMFDKRIKQGKEIQLHEIVYPILQGWDSVMLKSDLTIIGTDQKYNELQGRKLQTEEKQIPQDIISVPILVGTDGKLKMSQSLNNYIGIDDKPEDMFGKVMSIPDSIILHYGELAARMDLDKLSEIKKMINTDPKKAKIEVAKKIVEIYYPGKASYAEAYFNRIFVDKKNPDEMTVLKGKLKKNLKLVDFIFEYKLLGSKSEARRLIMQGGVKIDNEKINDSQTVISLHDEMIIQLGKRKFYKFKKDGK